MKNIFLMLFVFSVLLFASNDNKSYQCKVAGKNLIRCEEPTVRYDNGKYTVTVSLLRVKPDGSWIKKVFVGDNYYEDDAVGVVFVSKMSKAERWPCFQEIQGDSVYNVVGGECNEDLNFFMKRLSRGESFLIQSLGGNPLDSVGRFQEISMMKCLSNTHVITAKRNSITGLRTDGREYKNLKYSSYCEDFLASDALYWKPPKYETELARLDRLLRESEKENRKK